MNNIELGPIYGLIERIAKASKRYSAQELAALDRERIQAASDLQEEVSGLATWLESAERAIGSADEDGTVESLIHLRIHVMDIATAFDNLASDLALLFERKAIRSEAQKSLGGDN